MIEFELSFCLGRSNPEAYEQIVGRRYEGCWLWETLVEKVSDALHLTADGQDRLARWAACRTLRAYYPYARRRKCWSELSDDDAEHVIALIKFEFDFTRDYRSTDELETERKIAESFAHRLEEPHCSRCFEIMKGGARYMPNSLPSSTGVYVIYREMQDRIPTYIGEGKILTRFQSRHEGEWEWRELRRMYVNVFADEQVATKAGSLDAEKILLAVFNPPANNYHRVLHPDSLLNDFAKQS